MKYFKQRIPWQIKFGLKLIIATIGLTAFFQKIKLFRHGDDSVARHFETFKDHFSEAKNVVGDSFTVLELGPGYSVATAYFAEYVGASHAYLVDRGSFMDERSAQTASAFLKRDNGRGEPSFTFMSEGLESLKKIPSQSVDFIFSNAVLEHVKKDELFELLKETYRILTDEGVCVHTVDFKDHLGGSIHHLRFSDNFWNRELIYNSGFYTNRVRASEMLELFVSAGFQAEVISEQRFTVVPDIGKHHFSEDDLYTSSFRVRLTK